MRKALALNGRTLLRFVYKRRSGAYGSRSRDAHPDDHFAIDDLQDFAELAEIIGYVFQTAGKLMRI